MALGVLCLLYTVLWICRSFSNIFVTDFMMSEEHRNMFYRVKPVVDLYQNRNIIYGKIIDMNN